MPESGLTKRVYQYFFRGLIAALSRQDPALSFLITSSARSSAQVIGANLPDVDAACFFWLEGVEHLGFRRGITHGPPALVLGATDAC